MTSVMVDWEIRNALESKDLQITPLDGSLINPASIDVRLGNTVGVLRSESGFVDPLDAATFTYEYRKIGKKGFLLQPKQFILSCLLEKIGLSDTIAAEIKGKSSLGRCGLSNSSVAGWIDPGFGLPSPVTIELFNYSDYPILLQSCMKIGQLILYKVPKCQEGYGNRKTSKYHAQVEGQGCIS